jgi:hypothetical protein
MHSLGGEQYLKDGNRMNGQQEQKEEVVREVQSEVTDYEIRGTKEEEPFKMHRPLLPISAETLVRHEKL